MHISSLVFPEQQVPYMAHRGYMKPWLGKAGLEDITCEVLEGTESLPWRMLCMTSVFDRTYEEELSKVVTSEGQASAQMQLVDEFQGFCRGDFYRMPLDTHPVWTPQTAWTWELKTPDLRIYGWFVKRDLFVAHSLWNADESHTPSSGYGGVTQRARAIRDYRQENFPDLTYVKSVRLGDVFSNQTG